MKLNKGILLIEDIFNKHILCLALETVQEDGMDLEEGQYYLAALYHDANLCDNVKSGDTLSQKDYDKNICQCMHLTADDMANVRHNFVQAANASKYVRFLGAYGHGSSLIEALEYEFSCQDQKSATVAEAATAFSRSLVAVEFDTKSAVDFYACDAWTRLEKVDDVWDEEKWTSHAIYVRKSFGIGNYDYPEIVVEGLPSAIIVKKEFKKNFLFSDVEKFASENKIEIKFFDEAA